MRIAYISDLDGFYLSRRGNFRRGTKTYSFHEACPVCEYPFFTRSDARSGECCSISCSNSGERHYNYGKRVSDEIRARMSRGRKGMRFSDEHRRNKGLAQMGSKNPGWVKDRSSLKTPTYDHIRSWLLGVIRWPQEVYRRDNYDCQSCGKHGGHLEAHHVKTLKSIIEEHDIQTIDDAKACEILYDVNNGITLCKDCHDEIRASET